MTSLEFLAAMEHEDPEYVPEILPEGARISVKGSVKTFLALFGRAAQVTPAKEVIAGTGYALLEGFYGDAGELPSARITATDGEQTIQVLVDDVQVGRAGSVLVPPKRIYEILRLAPHPLVVLEADGTAMTIRSGRARWTVQMPTGDSLRQPLDVDDVLLAPVPIEPFLHALGVAYAAMPKSDARPAMMQAEVRNATITACSGPQAHRQVIEEFPADLDFCIPLRTVEELLRALKNTDELTVEVGANERHIVFRIGSDSIIARRLLLPFPNVDSLLLGPTFANRDALTIERLSLVEVVKRVRVNADQDFSAVTLTLVPGKLDANGDPRWIAVISAKDRIGNASREALRCQFTGPPVTTALTFNHRYLLDLLECYPGELLPIKLGRDLKTIKTPLLIEDSTLGFTGVVQQMRSF